MRVQAGINTEASSMLWRVYLLEISSAINLSIPKLYYLIEPLMACPRRGGMGEWAPPHGFGISPGQGPPISRLWRNGLRLMSAMSFAHVHSLSLCVCVCMSLSLSLYTYIRRRLIDSDEALLLISDGG